MADGVGIADALSDLITVNITSGCATDLIVETSDEAP